MGKTYYIEVSQHEKNEYTVESNRFADEESRNGVLPAYQQMVDWMKEQLQLSKDGKAQVHKFTPEYDAERDMNITNLETTRTGPFFRVVPDNEIVRKAETPFTEKAPELPFQAKGYSLCDDAYYFATVDTWRTIKPYRAESPEQALQMAKRDQLHNVLTKVQPIRQFLHADKYERVRLTNGQTVDIVTEKEFQDKLREKFPDGLTVRLADENFNNLVKLKNWNALNADEFDDWMGLGNPGDCAMLVAHGNIPAELKLIPEDYKYLNACEETYYNQDLSDLIEDEGITAPSLLMAEEPELKAFRLKIPKVRIMQDRLYIAGQPYKTMMDIAMDNNIKNDPEFEHLLDKIYMHKQPGWIQELAKKMTTEQRHKSFINLTAKATAEYNKAYMRLLEEAVTKFGYGPVEKLSSYLNHPETVPENLKEKIYQAAVFIHENMLPFERAQNKAYEQYNRKITNLQAEFSRQFNDFVDEKVNEVTLYPNNQNKWNVRLKINGEQQMGKTISDADANVRKERKPRNIKQMACKYFQDEIITAMTAGQELDRKNTLHNHR